MADPLENNRHYETRDLDPERRQQTRMLLAAFLLLFAVFVVVFRDRNSLFSEDTEALPSEPVAAPAQAAGPVTVARAAEPTRSKSRKESNRTLAAAAPKETSPEVPIVGPADHPAVTASRAVLPPL